jgi:adenosylcobinamide-GDP ribazoletransferase
MTGHRAEMRSVSGGRAKLEVFSAAGESNYGEFVVRFKLKSLFLAISFLSRLLPGRAADEEEMSSSLFWFPVAGLLLGLLLALPFFFLQNFTRLTSGHGVLLGGLLYTAAHAWLTRALHWDGWADIFDALGSGKERRDFYRVLKDSRIGTFGALALFLGLAGMVFAAAGCLEAGKWPTLIFAAVLGRCMVAPLTFGLAAAPESTLGALFRARAIWPDVAPAVCFALLCGLVCAGLAQTIQATLAAACGIALLRRLAVKHDGLNGDFIGCTIVWGELGALLAGAVSP